jgi:hypothetical protein
VYHVLFLRNLREEGEMANQVLDRLRSYENLVWAWRKLLNVYRRSELWFDELKLARFELHLDAELESLAESFSSGHFTTQPLRPLPQPKRDADGHMEVRQSFFVSVRDQLAWLAYMNVVGPELDSQMPPWSYGNRLFRSWIVQQEEAPVPKFIPGPYRNTRGQVYRPFKQGWPLYKRHVVLTLKKLTRARVQTFDDKEEQLLEAEPILQRFDRLAYLRKDFWKRYSTTAFWCGFDIEKFYPSVSLTKVVKAMMTRSESANAIGLKLLTSLTHFDVDLKGWSAYDLEQMRLSRDATTFESIPTGLITAGFLANVAMLPVDDWVITQVTRRQLAHFRYVDDHIVVAPSFDQMVNWFFDYRERLKEELGCSINEKKTEPAKIRRFLKGHSQKSRRIARKACKLDPEFPSPLMTKTLEKVSDLAHTNFDLLDSDEQKRVLHDLEHLLLAPLPEEELPQKTRVTFSATLLGRLTVQRERNGGQLLEAILKRTSLIRDEKNLTKQLRTLRRTSGVFNELQLQLRQNQKQIKETSLLARGLRQRVDDAQSRSYRRTASVLLKALRLHPEKLRMWERVLDFARGAGISASLILDPLRSIRKENRLASALIGARLFQVLTTHCFISISDCFNPSIELSRRIAAAQYLSTIDRTARRMGPKTNYYYVRAAMDTISAALAFAAAAALANQLPSDLPVRVRDSLRRALRRSFRATYTGGNPETIWWIGRKYGFWGDQKLKAAALQVELDALSANSPTSWKIWRLLGLDVPDRALLEVANAEGISKGAEGWIAEVLQGKPARVIRRLKGSSGRLGRVARSVSAKSRTHISLPDWINWTASNDRNLFDPRLSEWTALEITQQVLSCARKEHGESLIEAVSSIFNFGAPKRWIQHDDGLLTWEEWHQSVATDLVHLRGQLKLRDMRTLPMSSDYPDIDAEYSCVRAVAVILLSLLRRDYRLPNALLSTGYQGLLNGALIRHVQNRPCSSRTMAILESCLMDRSVETMWLQLDEDERIEQDIVRDVPLIQTLDDLSEQIKIAQSVLLRYQMTVSAHEPRQLVPIALEQFTHANWRPEVLQAEVEGEEAE